MPTVELDGVVLHYESEGKGAPFIVLHGGLGLDHQLYRKTLPPLFDGFRLIFFDMRGNGRSVPADLSALTMEQLADDVVALADHLGLDRFTALGHSYGGFVAQELALRHPDRLDGIVLVDTTPGQLGTGEDAGESQGPPPPPEVVAMMSSIPEDDASMAEGMGAMLPAYFHRPDKVDLSAFDSGTIFRVAAMVRGFEILSSWSSVDRLATVEVPTLVLAGRHDVFTSYPQAYRIGNRVSGAAVVIFEDSGHFPWVEEPELFASVVRDWHATESRYEG